MSETPAQYIGCGTEGITAPCWQCGAPMAQSGPEICEKCSYVNFSRTTTEPTREELARALRAIAACRRTYLDGYDQYHAWAQALNAGDALAARLPGGGE